MLEIINDKIKQAMKAKQKQELEALRYLKAMLLENKTSKNPKEELDVVISHHKKLKDSMTQYAAGSEQANKLQAEADIISQFLPQQLTQKDVQELIDKIKASMEKPNMGAIMKELSGQIKGKFDGKKASEMVKSSL